MKKITDGGGGRKSARKPANWLDREDKAIERFVTAWDKHQIEGNDEEVSLALDALTVAHAAVMFERGTGPLKW
jgi:hypothetical protein